MNPSTIVAKFGGAPLADAAGFRRAADIVRANPNRRLVVVSAPGARYPGDPKVTDLLLQAHGAEGSAREAPLAAVLDRFEAIVANLGLSFQLRDTLEKWRLLLGLAAAGQLSQSATVALGEYMSAAIMAALLGYDLAEADELIRFADDGTLDQNETRILLQKELRGDRQAVIPGFYGAKADGTVVTFSRGGSDLTATLVAESAGASLVEFWKDVPGVLRTDPRVVPDARIIPRMHTGEMRELAFMGASVLHQDAVFPAIRAGIPMRVCGVSDPANPGTLIEPPRKAPPTPPAETVTGIAGKKGFGVLTLVKAGMNDEVGFVRRVAAIFERHGVSIRHLPTGIDAMSVVVDADALTPVMRELGSDIVRECGCAPRPGPPLALICLVGLGMAQTPGVAGRTFGALGRANINVRLIDQCASETSVILGVDEDDYEFAVLALYAEFEKDRPA